MPITAKPEVLPPGRRAGPRVFTDENLDRLSHLLDDFIRIPGTPIRFGLDGIVGFIPGVGDLIAGLASMIIILAAWMRGVPRVTIARMALNVAIEPVVGWVPFLGNIFDIAWRANRRNYRLLEESIASPERHTATSRLILLAFCMVLIALILVPALLLGWLIAHLSAALAVRR